MTFTNELEDPILEIHRIRRENVKKYPTAKALAAYFEMVPSVEEFLEDRRREKKADDECRRERRAVS